MLYAMNEIAGHLIEFATSNQIATAVISAAIIGLFAWFVKLFRDNRDNKKIYEFMRRSLRETNFRFRTTEAISSATRIPEDRVAKLCSKHKKIRRNQKEKQSWQLVE
jgi:hypothetical protein